MKIRIEKLIPAACAAACAVLCAAACAVLCVFSLTAASVLRGDFTGDGEVNSADAVALLRGIMLPDAYPLLQGGDVNGDGEVNSADAVYLLRYVLLPESYPLSGEGENEEEEKMIREAYEKLCREQTTAEGDFYLNCGLSCEFDSEEYFLTKLLDALGLDPERYSVSLAGNFDYSALALDYRACNGGSLRVTVPFTVRGENGGEETFEPKILIYKNLTDALGEELKKIITEKSVWNGKKSSEGHLELKCTRIDRETLEKVIEASFDFTKLSSGVRWDLTLEDNEYLASLLGAFEEAENGEEVCEYVDVTIDLTTDDTMVHFPAEIETVLTRAGEGRAEIDRGADESALASVELDAAEALNEYSFCLVPSAAIAEDCVIDLAAQPLGGPGFACGLVFGAAETDDGFEGYFLAADNGQLTLSRITYSRSELLRREEITSRKTGLEPGESFALRMTREGDLWYFYLLDDAEGFEPWPEIILSSERLGELNGDLIGVFSDGIGCRASLTAEKHTAEELPEQTYVNPVYSATQAADPCVMKYDGKYYCYSTSAGIGYYVYVSEDLVNWENAGSCMGQAWGINKGGYYWAPEVVEKDGKFVMVMTVDEHLGFAVASSPLGPFEPLPGWTFDRCIDGHIFIDDDGQAYLYCTDLLESGYIVGYELEDDLTTVRLSTKTVVLRRNKTWERGVSEGPYMLKHNGLYYLTYSGNGYTEPGYSVGYAVSDSPLGEFEKPEANPILTDGVEVFGPGHHSFTVSPDGSELIIVYHAHRSHTEVHPRTLCIDRARFSPTASGIDRLEVYGPTFAPQPYPSAGNGAAEAETAEITAAVEKTLADPDYTAGLYIQGIYPARFTEKYLSGALLDLFGLDRDRFALSVADFEKIRSDYSADNTGSLKKEITFTVTGENGGEYRTALRIGLMKNITSMLRETAAKCFNASEGSAWNGKNSDDGYFELSLCEFPTGGLLSRLIEQTFALSHLPIFVDFSFSLIEDEYFDGLREAFESAEVGDTVEEYVDSAIRFEYGGAVLNLVPCFEIVLTKDESTKAEDLLLPYRAGRFGEYAAPTGLSEYTPAQATLVTDADFYVAPDGSDGGDGSFEAPFATFERAKKAVGELKDRKDGGVTVAFMAGRYDFAGISFDPSDSGSEGAEIRYCAYGDGEVTFTGGVRFEKEAFVPLGEDEKARFGSSADRIRKLSLADFGVEASNLEDVTELFSADGRMICARWPNILPDGSDDFAFDSAKCAAGQFDKKLRVSESLAKRLDSYGNVAGGRYVGYLYYDWHSNDGKLIDWDGEVLTVQYAGYGIGENPYFYFYNIPEELDAPGEYYIDREKGILYVYEPDADYYELSVRSAQISASGLEYVTFEGIGVTCSAASGGFSLTSCKNISVIGCRAENIGTTGIYLTGSHAVIRDCTVSNTGDHAIHVFGGSRAQLIPADITVDNNLLHDFAQINKVYQCGVAAEGVGITVSHNEIFNSPHAGFIYNGNDIVFEYNYVHDVVRQSSDAGATYAGRDWTEHGCVLRYNVFRNVGSERFSANGIYLDDGLSGQTVYGNLFYNIANNALMIGGGRDNVIRDNIVIGAGRGVYFDARFRSDYDKGGGTFYMPTTDAEIWTHFYAMPVQSEIWKAKYPHLALIIDDYARYEDIDFPINPSYNDVGGNVVIGSIDDINKYVPTYGSVSESALFDFDEDPGFVSVKDGDYRSVSGDVPVIPIGEIGRY